MNFAVEARDLAVEYSIKPIPVLALDGATLHLGRDETLGLVGESGSGKTTLANVIGRILPTSAYRRRGDLLVEGQSVFNLNRESLRRMRREVLGFVLQNPIDALDPTRQVGRLMADALGRRHVDTTAIDRLAELELDEPERVARSFPHELSGGMAQRAAIAIGLANRPRIVIADEPTASLDSSVRLQVLRSLIELRRKTRSSLMLLSHDLVAVARFCDRVAVMYGGRVVEFGASEEVLHEPRHPYTRALIAANPALQPFGRRAVPIGGSPPTLHKSASSCTFAARCTYVAPICMQIRPEPRMVLGRSVLCHLAEEIQFAERDTAN